MVKYIKGIDVAAWEPNINWEKVCAQDIHFAFIKASQADFMDALFEKHWNGAKRAGILRGAYHFIDPRIDGRKQAETYLRIVNFEPGDLPPVLDLEDLPDEPVQAPAGKKGTKDSKDAKGSKGGRAKQGVKGGKAMANTSDVPNAKVIDCVNTWITIVEKETGRKPILYSSPSYLHSRLSGINGKPPAWSMKHVLWLANYLKREVTDLDLPFQPSGWSQWSFWQYSDRGLLDGIMDNDERLTGVDLNFFRGTLEELRALAGSNLPDGSVANPPPVSPMGGESKSENPVSPPVVDLFQHRVKAGDTLSGIALRYHTSIAAILAVNPQIKNVNMIRDGETINIPN